MEPVVVELDGHLEGLNGLSEFGGLAAGQTVDFVLNLGDLVVQLNQGFLGRFMLVQKRLTLSEVLLSLIDVKGQFVLQVAYRDWSNMALVTCIASETSFAF